ncbi:hypothetical protein [Mycolicibacterium sphagni]|uniref:Uncharacterized protein n=1 Tax=Mycolicibacterium sphagni TaxID=1786 RepID=A0A255DGW0_9MYCO|nr:hypothetical protein [Mycolicibacterium sphagni]OYN76192.1 hypothetical protein CG716_22860 [Mycolicibacterium sphagni]
MRVHIGRPELRNRFDKALQVELATALRRLSDHDAGLGNRSGIYRAGVLGGGDFAVMQAAHDDATMLRYTVALGRDLLHAFLGLRQPIIGG